MAKVILLNLECEHVAVTYQTINEITKDNFYCEHCKKHKKIYHMFESTTDNGKYRQDIERLFKKRYNPKIIK